MTPSKASEKEECKKYSRNFNNAYNTTELSYDEKLAIVKNEAEILYEFALSKGLSSTQIRTCLSPILDDDSSTAKRFAAEWYKTAIILSILVSLSSVTWSIPSSKELIIAHSRLLWIKTLHIWDWTDLFYRDCVFYNPLHQTADELPKDNCNACVTLQEIQHMKEVNVREVTELLYAGLPYLVTDATKDWPKEENGKLLFKLNHVKELFQKSPILTEEATDCVFFSTVDGQENITQFAESFAVDELPAKFHVAWENCNSDAAKVFRILATRPYFIPPFAEASPHNQIVLAKGNFDGEDFELPQQIDSATWLVLIEGKMAITLKPPEACFQCKKYTFDLGEGEAVMVPSRTWNMSYVPISESYTLSYSSTLIWDDVI